METPAPPEHDPSEAIRVAIMLVGLAFNLWILWDYISERPEVQIARRRMAMWWKRKVADPEQRIREMQRAERETVFEAIQVVTDAGS